MQNTSTYIFTHVQIHLHISTSTSTHIPTYPLSISRHHLIFASDITYSWNNIPSAKVAKISGQGRCVPRQEANKRETGQRRKGPRCSPAEPGIAPRSRCRCKNARITALNAKGQVQVAAGIARGTNFLTFAGIKASHLREIGPRDRHPRFEGARVPSELDPATSAFALSISINNAFAVMSRRRAVTWPLCNDNWSCVPGTSV